MILHLPAPPALVGDQLVVELAEAGIVATVVLAGDQLEISTQADDVDEAAVAAAVAAHEPTPPAPPVDLAAELDELRVRLDALEALPVVADAVAALEVSDLTAPTPGGS